jgi:hypothetical protein
VFRRKITNRFCQRGAVAIGRMAAALVESAELANLPSIGLSLFAHAFELGLLLLRHELTAFLVALREGLFPHCLGRELRTLLHCTLAVVVPGRLVCCRDVLLSSVVVDCFKERA